MNIKKKFYVFAMISGIIISIISSIGYYTAQKHLLASITQEISTTTQLQADAINAWVVAKLDKIEGITNTLQSLDANVHAQAAFGGIAGDKDIQELYFGGEDASFMTWTQGAFPLNPLERAWYKDTKAANKMMITPPYVDKITNKVIISATMPYRDKANNFKGVLGGDISLVTLERQAAQLKYLGEGQGFIIDKSGMFLACTEDQSKVTKNMKEDTELKEFYQTMLNQENGMFSYEKNGEKRAIVYTKVESTGWIVGMEVPESVIYKDITTLKVEYLVSGIIGFLLMLLLSLQFAKRITKPIIALNETAQSLATGNLAVQALPVQSRDEIGTLTSSFNHMSESLRELIQKVSNASEHVAASSEELTASASQSAEASNHVAAIIAQVATGMDKQLDKVEQATHHIHTIVKKIGDVSEHTRKINLISTQTSVAAQQGQDLMKSATMQMDQTEEIVAASAVLVTKLSENSSQIEEIINVISGIAGQTNLLALNAAIEAARAGEQGRGFAVVAEEVRKLAEQSKNATEEIKSLIARIQVDIQEVVESMNHGSHEVKTGTATIHEVGTEFASILEMVHEISSKIDEAAGSIENVVGDSKEVIHAIDEIQAVSRQTVEQTQTISAATQEESAATQEIASSSHTVSKMAEELQAMASKFRL